MKLHPVYILKEQFEKLRAMSAPAAIDGNTTPKHAYLLGYLDALQALTDAFQVKAKNLGQSNSAP
jgi:hypothetical protein